MFAELAGVVAPIFIVAGLGYVWSRSDTPFDTEFVTTLVFNVGAPCLVFSALSSLTVPVETFGEVAVAAVTAYILFFVVASAVVLAARLPYDAYMPPLSFPNAGNMGLPISFFAFGEQGLAFAVVFYITGSVLQFTVGVIVTSGHFDLGRLLRVPLIYATALGLVFAVAGARPPVWLLNTTELIGNLTIPLMLIALGVALGRLKVASIKRSLVLSLTRLATGLAIGLGLSALLGLEGAARGITIIQCTMPVAVFNYLLSSRYGRMPEEVAGMIVMSTLISFATLPLLILIALG